jgi:hypothetical protein
MKSARYHPLWGSLSPLGGLSGLGLLIMASARLSWALTVAGSLLWVYILSVPVSAFLCSDTCKNFFPRSGRPLVFVCLSSFFGSLYLFIFWLLCPFAVLEVFLPLSLVPLYCAGSGFFAHETGFQDGSPEGNNRDIADTISASAAEAAVLAGLLIIISVIREPLGFCSLSLPGSYRGMIMLFSFKEGTFFPVRIITSSSGALLLAGYVSCLYRYFRSVHAPSEAEE